MNETFRVYLEHLGRLRERDHWSAWLADVAAHTTFSEAVALAERNRAWSLFTQGHVDEAVLMLEALIERLQKTIVFDATFQLAVSQTQLGRIYQHAGHDERAIPILSEAAVAWEQVSLS
jgi:tetratricopeptide (TPR) repeat protein